MSEGPGLCCWPVVCLSATQPWLYVIHPWLSVTQPWLSVCHPTLSVCHPALSVRLSATQPCPSARALAQDTSPVQQVKYTQPEAFSQCVSPSPPHRAPALLPAAGGRAGEDPARGGGQRWLRRGLILPKTSQLPGEPLGRLAVVWLLWSRRKATCMFPPLPAGKEKSNSAVDKQTRLSLCRPRPDRYQKSLVAAVVIRVEPAGVGRDGGASCPQGPRPGAAEQPRRRSALKEPFPLCGGSGRAAGPRLCVPAPSAALPPLSRCLLPPERNGFRINYSPVDENLCRGVSAGAPRLSSLVLVRK